MSRAIEILRPVIRRTAPRPYQYRFFRGWLRVLLQFILYFALLIAVTLALAIPAYATEVPITATRIWPAPDYTRVTIESKQPVKHTLFSLDNPDRLVLDRDDRQGHKRRDPRR